MGCHKGVVHKDSRFFAHFMRRCENQLKPVSTLSWFKPGHKHSEASRQKMSESAKKRFMNPANRNLLSEAHKAAWTPERRENMSKLRTGEKRSAETRQKMSESALRRSAVKKVSRREKAGKKSWKDPGHREKWREGIMKAIESGEGVKKMWADNPEQAKKWVAGMLAAVRQRAIEDGGGMSR